METCRHTKKFNSKLKNGTRAPTSLAKPNATIIFKKCSSFKNDSEFGKRDFHQFVELKSIESNPLIFDIAIAKTMQFNQYSRLAIL